jgi:hypothetical protein
VIEDESSTASQGGQTVEAEESSTPAEKAGIEEQEDQYDILAHFADIASVISCSGHPIASKYQSMTLVALAPKDVLQSIVATQLSVTNSLTLEQAAAIGRAKSMPEAGYHLRALKDLSRLTLELTNAYITMQKNTQINQIKIEKVSVEKGAQAIVGCVTNAPTEQKRLRVAHNENQEVSRPRIRAKRRSRAS